MHLTQEMKDMMDQRNLNKYLFCIISQSELN